MSGQWCRFLILLKREELKGDKIKKQKKASGYRRVEEMSSKERVFEDGFYQM